MVLPFLLLLFFLLVEVKAFKELSPTLAELALD